MRQTVLERKKILDHATPSQVDDAAEKLLEIQTDFTNELIKYKDRMSSGLTGSWKEIRDVLADDEIAIEFMTVKDGDTDRMLSFSVSKESKFPEMREICDVVDFDMISDMYGSDELYKAVWKPLEDLIAGKKKIYFSPEGHLHQIAIEYAQTDKDDQNISDMYNLYRLSTTRELVEKGTSTENKNFTATLFGGMKYSISKEKGENQSMKTDEGFYSAINRSGIKYLPGTLEEVTVIDDIFKINGHGCTTMTGEDASEEAFKQLSGSDVSILHVATHGFYVPAGVRTKLTSLYGYVNARSSSEDVSLGRSGLMFSGSANTLDKKGSDRGEDGILTAREISRLNFNELDLVVLSACETGLGDITHEGVYGLERGFKKAGAKTIVMSLWKVDDQATNMLMKEFYCALVSGMSKQEAFTSARNKLRQTAAFKDPRFWAAFIMTDGLN